MLDKNQAAEIFNKLKTYSSADEIEAIFYGGKTALTRYANNIIHQNVAEENYGVSVRTVFGGRTARATTNKLDDESLKRVVEASESLAKVQHPDPDLLPVADKSVRATQALPSRHFPQTAALTPQDRAESVKKIVAVAEKHKLTTAGVFSCGDSLEGLFNSRGLSQWHSQTSSEISITMLADKSSGCRRSRGNRRAQSHPVRRSARAASWKAHCDSGTGSGTRHGRIHVLGLRRTGHTRSTVISHQPRGDKTLRRQHQYLGRRLSSVAIRLCVRWRRSVAAAPATGRKWSHQAIGVRSRDGGEDEEVRAHSSGRSG